MRWQHRSVQFEAPQFLSWKIPSSDQQRDTTHAIAKYKLMDFLRLRARGDALNDSLDDCEEIFSNADEEVAEARRDVHVLLAQLPDRQRLPIQLVKLQGLSVAEAAQATGFSESAVKIGVHRGLKALALHIRSVR